MNENLVSWNLSDLKDIKKNGLKVMSTFACGGGSSMGYKKAGFDVVAANDIDPVMARHYKKNINPRHYFLCPIKEVTAREDLPDELYNLDILDGSPPCSTFSMCGSREKAWGKEKHFREGQAKQVLDDLFFDFIDLAGKLQPKVIIAENVKGMLVGKAKWYTKEVMKRLVSIGYKPQLFLVNAANCGVPQNRERIFFIASRNDLNLDKIMINPKKTIITARKAMDGLDNPQQEELITLKPSALKIKYYRKTKPGSNFSFAVESYTGKKGQWFSRVRLNGSKPSATLTATHRDFLHWSDERNLTLSELVRLGSFPDDYKFESRSIGKYMIGMSVPPLMTEYIASEVARQWLKH